MNDHLPSVRVTVEDADGHGALFITCRGEGCDYETGRARSQKQAWADFRAHARGGTTAQPETPPPVPSTNQRCFEVCDGVTMTDCPVCGPVDHEAVPEDEAHCGCEASDFCRCPCHGTEAVPS